MARLLLINEFVASEQGLGCATQAAVYGPAGAGCEAAGGV